MKKNLPCLILAGGLGTRLRSVLGEEFPKALASIKGQPFLSWLLQCLSQQGFTEVVLSVGYGRDRIKESLCRTSFNLSITLIEEDEPLGTGGAIKNALKVYGAPEMIVLNGDSMSDVRLGGLQDFFHMMRSDLVLAAAQVEDASRYASLRFDATSRRLHSLGENCGERGYINAGVYAINVARLLSIDTPKKFSFEHDFLRYQLKTLDIRVFPNITQFIDIGIPLDYERAQIVVPQLLGSFVDEA